MEFKTPVQKACYEKVQGYMRELFGELAVTRDDAPVFMVGLGSALVHIGVWPWGDDDATITTRSWVVRGAEVTPDMMQYLLKENATMRFGAFGLDSDNDVTFEHTIVGSSCDKSELKASVLAVLSTTDRCDEELVARWGGQRGLD